jgi:hypothetical protein
MRVASPFSIGCEFSCFDKKLLLIFAAVADEAGVEIPIFFWGEVSR